MCSQNVNHHYTVFFAATSGNLFHAYDVFPVVLHLGIEVELTAGSRAADRPPGEASRYFLYVLLSVTAVDTQCVEFHDLPCIIFIQAAVRIFRNLAVSVQHPLIPPQTTHSIPTYLSIRRDAQPVIK